MAMLATVRLGAVHSVVFGGKQREWANLALCESNKNRNKKNITNSVADNNLNIVGAFI